MGQGSWLNWGNHVSCFPQGNHVSEHYDKYLQRLSKIPAQSWGEKKTHKETKEKITRGNSNVQNPLWGSLLWGLMKLWELLWIEYPRPFGTVSMLLSPGADWRWPIIWELQQSTRNLLNSHPESSVRGRIAQNVARYWQLERTGL